MDVRKVKGGYYGSHAEVDPAGEKRRRLQIDREIREQAAPIVEHIMACERYREQSRRIDTLTPAEASKLIRGEWRRTFGPRRKGPELPDRFFDQGSHSTTSMRSLRARDHSTTRRGTRAFFEGMQ